MSNNKCLAMLLAGGEGKRLNPLTGKWAKPAVPFGGKHRIIDFPISNCLNSGMDNIGILTQYKAESIHSYVRKGQLWNTKGMRQDGFTLLPSDRVGESGYAGTADAIYQNIDYIDSHAPEHVLILSGDHIYQMDYRPLLAYHEAKGAAATIVVKHVPWEEASRFGLMSTGEEDRITDFAEKPAEPKSNLASLGIYVFRWSDLRERLMADAADATSTHDFGKDIIPALLADEEPIYAYAYEGYWRDVGTIDSLWESNMDLLDGHLSFNHNEWPMNASPKSAILSSTLSAFANIKQSLLQQGVVAKGEVNRSVVSFGCQIGSQSQVKDSYLMPNTKIGKQARITRAIIGEGAIIDDYAVVGNENGEITVVAPGERVKANVYLSPSFEQVKEKLAASVKSDKSGTWLPLAK